MQQIDLTHTITTGLDVYPGDTPPHICQVDDLINGVTNSNRIEMGMHTGTHIDAPLHMIENGKKIPDYQVQKFHGRGVLIDARGHSQIHESLLENINLQPGDIVLVDTGHHKLFGKPEYYQSWPEVTEAFAQKIAASKVSLLGVDTPSPDPINPVIPNSQNHPFPIHKILLTNEVLIIENITNLAPLHSQDPSTPTEFTVTALPAKFDTEAAPTRVMATII